ncbi:hypothetical protein HKX54_01655 [Sulfitobacter sp. M57]|uniref:hypothetical protein n=1 Tax=unclassified Sulfitobacter TaxID=196795 RepID=UPI0023E0BBD1|nr:MULTISPECIES: hypothetical protein [unclassified Sulfitobacter]MDF3413147.1 hypothetical protein [Sulfitobacter sp. KE5]MDF3421570.1 hypothetical protein [Sulfitobacter sp. KE43]MDF3431696.1 hypothetical protein [Sulfitobacter sp. KE42]MDF3457337.1 hypothetical protein [Sulfitobacter sp. S74]MDF3461239.1 hypothetical protein [Sulfitobacter sp. Ks18]
MTRVLVLAAVAAASFSLPVWAQDAAKVESCGHQASVVAAIQQARLDRVKERKVQAHVLENATWPENFNTAIPLLTPWVYEMKMRDIRKKNLAEAWTELCLQQ